MLKSENQPRVVLIELDLQTKQLLSLVTYTEVFQWFRPDKLHLFFTNNLKLTLKFASIQLTTNELN